MSAIEFNQLSEIHHQYIAIGGTTNNNQILSNSTDFNSCSLRDYAFIQMYKLFDPTKVVSVVSQRSFSHVIFVKNAMHYFSEVLTI